MSAANGGSFGGADFGEEDPARISGVSAYRRAGRWLHLRLDDGRGLALDPVDVLGCEVAADGGSISVYLRGRESEYIENVDGWGLWDLLAASVSR